MSQCCAVLFPNFYPEVYSVSIECKYFLKLGTYILLYYKFTFSFLEHSLFRGYSRLSTQWLQGVIGRPLVSGIKASLDQNLYFIYHTVLVWTWTYFRWYFLAYHFDADFWQVSLNRQELEVNQTCRFRISNTGYFRDPYLLNDYIA